MGCAPHARQIDDRKTAVAKIRMPVIPGALAVWTAMALRIVHPLDDALRAIRRNAFGDQAANRAHVRCFSVRVATARRPAAQEGMRRPIPLSAWRTGRQ